MRQRARAYIFASTFLKMIILPRPLFVPPKEYVDTENYESRTYQEKPTLDFRNLRAVDFEPYPGQYSVYSNDYLAFKNPIVAFGKLTDTHVSGEAISDAVLMGKDGWVLYKLKGEMEGGIAGYQGTSCHSEEDLGRFVALLKQVNRNLVSGGTKLVFYMVPNREQVYSEFMLSSVRMVQEQSKADLLYAYLKESTDCDMYYPLDEFKKAGDDWYQIYRKYDTYWDDMGVFVASRVVIQDIDGESFGPESYRPYNTEDRGTFSGDLATMLNLQKYCDDGPFLKVSGYREDVSFEAGYQNEHETITHYSSDAEGKTERILIRGDLFGIHMAEYFVRDYSDVTLIDCQTEDCRAAVLELRPDAAVIEVAERYTDYTLGLLERLGIIGYGMELTGD